MWFQYYVKLLHKQCDVIIINYPNPCEQSETLIWNAFVCGVWRTRTTSPGNTNNNFNFILVENMVQILVFRREILVILRWMSIVCTTLHIVYCTTWHIVYCTTLHIVYHSLTSQGVVVLCRFLYIYKMWWIHNARRSGRIERKIQEGLTVGDLIIDDYIQHDQVNFEHYFWTTIIVVCVCVCVNSPWKVSSLEPHPVN